MAEIVNIGPAPSTPKKAATALEKGFAKANEQFPGATGLVMVMFDDNGNMACVEVNIEAQQIALASVRLAHIVNRALDET